MILLGWLPMTGGVLAGLWLALGLCKASSKPTPKGPSR